jgi:hypothetical protein
MMLSSHATPTFSSARVTIGHTSRRYFSRYCGTYMHDIKMSVHYLEGKNIP